MDASEFAGRGLRAFPGEVLVYPEDDAGTGSGSGSGIGLGDGSGRGTGYGVGNGSGPGECLGVGC